VDVVVASEGWSATPVEGAAQWITEVLARAGVGKVDALAVGAQGCEEPAHAEELRDALRERLGGVPVLVVNDAELLLPAAALERGIALIGGTGAIAVRSDGAGTTWRAGGWGWVLSDDGSASALVRDAARAVLAAADLGGPPGLLARRLLEAVGVPGIPELALALSWGEAPEHWGRYAPAVVGAAEEGDETARTVLAAGACALARLVDVLTARTGGTPEPVVAAGGLLTGVPSYWAAVESHLRAAHPTRDIRLLTSPPATGALALAYGLL
jgi:N-acetylglucosamine kinase-like BadF-type ATPase